MVVFFFFFFFFFFMKPTQLELPNIHTFPPQNRSNYTPHLVASGERRNGLALVLVQGGADNGAVAELGLSVGLLLPRESVLHPVLVVTVGIVLAGVGATGFLAVGGALGGLDGAGEQVAELEGLDEVGVPDHATILGADLGEHLVDLVDPDGKMLVVVS
jgi:hypothetical protein